MTNIHPNLYIGHQGDYEYQIKGQDSWAVTHAGKEPYHRNLLGYTGKGAPKDHPVDQAHTGTGAYTNMGAHTDAGAHVGAPLPGPTNHE